MILARGERLRIHLTAVCGVGMAPLAVALKQAGHEVTGSDVQAYPPMSEVLASAGIRIQEGFSPLHLEPRPDLVVIGNAVPKTNPEAQEIERLGIPRISFPEAVARFLIGSSRSLVVAGTHGKTTTTGMLSFVLDTAGLEPGYLVGGRVPDLGEFARAGSGRYFVVEGDEYDSAYFDKRPKFIHYRPYGVILTSIEFDHADIYRDAAHVESAFADLLALLNAESPLVACGEYDSIRRVVERVGVARVAWYGRDASAEWSYRDVRLVGNETHCEALHRGFPDATLRLAIPGEMNAANALAVYAMTRELGIDRAAVMDGLRRYRGAARRQQLVGEAGDITVIDDFAHHPTAVRMTLDAMRKRFPGRRLVAVFEPRSNTSRRAVFQDAYADALSGAAIAAISAVYAKPNDPLTSDQMLSTDRLVADLERRNTHAWSAQGPDAILARLPSDLRRGDVVVCMSNGSFGNLPRRLLDLLAAGAEAAVQP
jgi:UDP-N-acetylmuramate: L-alanyl-gamma-D-glutamyl-meso-diaminopimelate ligase